MNNNKNKTKMIFYLMKLTAEESVERPSPDFKVFFVGATIPDQCTLNVILWGQWAETQTC